MKNLNESSAAEQAHALGLEYLGFGGWGHSSDRVVLARTINGKLVRVTPETNSETDQDKGRLVVVDFDDELLYTNLKDNLKGDILRYVKFLKSLVKTGSEVIILHSRNSEKKVAKFLKSIGISAGPVLVPYGSSDPEKKRDFVENKIKDGYSEVYFYDRDPKAIHAIESLKAPYNKVIKKLETHQLPKLEYDPSKRKDKNDSAS